MFLLPQWQASNDYYSCGFGLCILFFALSLPLPQDVWVGYQLVPTKIKILFSPFSTLLLVTTPKMETQTISRQPTTSGCYLLVTLPIYGCWMLPVGYLAYLWSFLLFNHHESHIGSIPKAEMKIIFICPISTCS